MAFQIFPNSVEVWRKKGDVRVKKWRGEDLDQENRAFEKGLQNKDRTDRPVDPWNLQNSENSDFFQKN